ncbi:MAG: STAS domain-containing protein [Gammaproteobacteria bacterium]
MTVTIKDEKIDGKTVVTLDGRIDSSAAVEFESHMIQVINGGCNTMLVDFTNLVFISSAGLRVLLLAAKKVRPYGGKVLLCALSQDVQEVFDISGFSSIFSIYKTRQEAIDSMR